MNRNLHRSARGALVAITVLGAAAGAAEARTITGAVVHHNSRGHSFVLADHAGHLFAVHATRAPAIGSHVAVQAARLRDGTFRLQHAHRSGRAGRHVRVRGVVTFVNRHSGAITVSAPGVSMLVLRHHRHGTRAGDPSGTPSVGNEVVASGTVDDQGELEDANVQTVGQDSGGISLEGTVLAVDANAGTITVSADDQDQSGSSITVTVPSSLSISQFSPGDEVELQVQPTGPGTATLLGSADDGNAQSANDQSDEQGANPGSEDHGGGDGQTSGGDHGSHGDGGTSSSSSSGSGGGSSSDG